MLSFAANALAICAITAAPLKHHTGTQAPAPVRPDQPPPGDRGMIPLTVPQNKHLLAALLLRPRLPGHAAYWLTGDAGTRPAHAGSTSAHGSPGTPNLRWSTNERLLPYQAF